jgi:hypothetical protein
VKHLIAASFDSNLDLVFELLNLIESVIEFHLQIVTLKYDCFQMHLLLADHVLLERLTLLLDFINVLTLFGTSL